MGSANVNVSLTGLLDSMWKDYTQLNPGAAKIYNLLKNEGELVVNDHIALRTFQHPKLGIDRISRIFCDLGYEAKKDYFFKEKKLYAKHFEHPDLNQPKIFISELELQKFSPKLQSTVNNIIDQIPEASVGSPNFFTSGRTWKMSYQTYQELYTESEYAAWVSTFGFRPNHFTVSINHLKKFTEVTMINDFLIQNGFKMNASGGLIKGNPGEYLEQSSTMAGEISVNFDDGTHTVPACYYEFAKRYTLPDGKLYQGFVATSADKIFESTNRL